VQHKNQLHGHLEYNFIGDAEMYKEILFEIIDGALVNDDITTKQYIKLDEKVSKLNDFECWKIVREHGEINEKKSLLSEDKYSELLKGALQARGVPKEKILSILASRAKVARVGKGALDASKGIRRI